MRRTRENRIGKRYTGVRVFIYIYFFCMLEIDQKIIIIPYKISNLLNLNNPLNYKKKQSGLKTKVTRFQFLDSVSFDSLSSGIF